MDAIEIGLFFCNFSYGIYAVSAVNSATSSAIERAPGLSFAPGGYPIAVHLG
jgi:hypothetical protein